MTKFWRWKPHRRERRAVLRLHRHAPIATSGGSSERSCCATLLAIVVPLVALPRGRYVLARSRLAGAARRDERRCISRFHDRNRPGLAAVSPSRHRRVTPAIERDLRFDRTGLPGPHALRRARSGSWTACAGAITIKRSSFPRRCSSPTKMADRIECGRAPTRSGSAKCQSRAASSRSFWFPIVPSFAMRSKARWRFLSRNQSNRRTPGAFAALSRHSMRRCGESCSATRSCRASSWTRSTRRRNACGAISKARLKTRVSIVNAGVLGYSPEQYYYSLVAFADRFRPQFVVVSVFANDFGEASEVTSRAAAIGSKESTGSTGS